jgi:RNA polymerase sigma factor (sigma-70 family)
LSGDRGLAEDLTQDVLIKVQGRWDHIGSLELTDSYVRRMLVNEFLSWRRKWARIIPAAEVSLSDDRPDHAHAHADRQILRAELDRLPAKQQIVLTLRYFCGLSDSDIAAVTGWRPGTIRGYISRALATLRIQPALRQEYSSSRQPQELEQPI